MAVDQLLSLSKTGNWASVESEWTRVLSEMETGVAGLVPYATVLTELTSREQMHRAADLAMLALETVGSGASPRDVAAAAGTLLVSVGNHPGLRQHVTDLYRKAYGDVEGLDALISHAGITEGRPVRRAVRAMEVCLAAVPGSFLISRHEESAARVESVDRSSWEFSLHTGKEEVTFAGVELADEYDPAHAEDYRVMRHFSLDELVKRAVQDPAWVVRSVCHRFGSSVDSDVLQSELVPGIISAKGWSKWFTAARGELRKSAHFVIEGRSPYTIRYVPAPSSPETNLLAAVEKAHSVERKLDLMEDYIRESRRREADLNPELLQKCHANVSESVGEATGPGVARKHVLAAIAGELAGVPAAAEPLHEWLASQTDLKVCITGLTDDREYIKVLDGWQETHPQTWREDVAAIFPLLPMDACEHASRRLLSNGYSAEQFVPIIQQIFTQPKPHFEALLWLWSGPRREKEIYEPSLPSLFTRLLSTLEQIRRDERLPKDRAQKLRAKAKSAVTAGKYKRFQECLNKIDADMARAMRTPIKRSDVLGTTVHDDLHRMLREQFPSLDFKAKVPNWARENVLFTTNDGLRRRQAEHDELVNVKMRENAKAIGEAASHGDLSENSEYKFALEERDLLRARLAQINSELAMAQVLDPADVPTDRVGIGTWIGVRRVSDGATGRICFLSSWDTDAERNIFNYKAPAGQKLMEKTMGDIVDLDLSGFKGEYEIVSLENSLTDTD